MRIALLAVLPALALVAGPGEAMPLPTSAMAPSHLVIIPIADGCGPGLVRGRLGTCLKRRAVFSHGRIVRKGCGKPVGEGLRTPC